MGQDFEFSALGGPSSRGFSTVFRNMDYGVNVEGTYAGVSGECVRGESDRGPDVGGVGVYGRGDNFGVLGEIHRGGEHRIAAIYGRHRTGGVGVIGAVMPIPSSGPGIGVAGVSLRATLGNPLEAIELLNSADKHGAGTGVLGCSGSGIGVQGRSVSGDGVVGTSKDGVGVRGASATNAAVLGENPIGAGVAGRSEGGIGVLGICGTSAAIQGMSGSGRGGVFESSGTPEGPVAQVRLVPQSMPVPAVMRSAPVQFDTRAVLSLPRAGRSGDLLVTRGEDRNCTLWFCARSSEGENPAVWRQVLLGSPVGADEVVEVLWPQQVLDPPSTGNPQNVLLGPNGTTYTVETGVRATFRTFAGRAYPELPDLLSRPSYGDVVSAEAIARSDVVAFERNGGSPASGQGWESCDWTFADGVAQIFVSWNGTAGASRDPHVVANGSIWGADYVRCFGAASAPGYDPIADDEVISFLLFALPELRAQDPRFTIAVSGSSSSTAGEITPDIDAIGVLRLRP